jgi:MFS family permease
MSDHVPPKAWATLALLTTIYAFNFLDRTLIYILFAPIRKDMELTDLQLALLGTTSFVMFYTLLGVPFGRLADRVRRRWLIAAGLSLWSVASGLSGFATGFWSLFLCRVLVGVGEATLAPAATSLIAELFPASRRATAQSLYSSGIPLGAAGAFFFGGWIAENFGWRTAFMALGFPGLLLALAVLFVPEDDARVVKATAPVPVQWGDLLGRIRTPVAGYAVFAVAANSLSIWVPSTWLHRVHGFGLAETGQLAGLAMLTTGAVGTAAGGSLADAWQRRVRGGRMRTTSVLAMLCAPAWIGLLYGPTPVAVACYFALAGLGLAWLGPAAADVQDLVGPERRGVGIAAYVLVVNIVGYGIAPPTMGWISDQLGTADDPLRMAWVLLICPMCCIAASAILWLGALQQQAAEA